MWVLCRSWRLSWFTHCLSWISHIQFWGFAGRCPRWRNCSLGKWGSAAPHDWCWWPSTAPCRRFAKAARYHTIYYVPRGCSSEHNYPQIKTRPKIGQNLQFFKRTSSSWDVPYRLPVLGIPWNLRTLSYERIPSRVEHCIFIYFIYLFNWLIPSNLVNWKILFNRSR